MRNYPSCYAFACSYHKDACDTKSDSVSSCHAFACSYHKDACHTKSFSNLQHVVLSRIESNVRLRWNHVRERV